jgi:predicted transcriptional regulator
VTDVWKYPQLIPDYTSCCSEEELTWLNRRPIFDELDEEAEARAIAKDRAEIAGGQGIPHDEVMTWLRSWGTPSELPAPKPGRR